MAMGTVKRMSAVKVKSEKVYEREAERAADATADAFGAALYTMAGGTWTAVAAARELKKVLAKLKFNDLSSENIDFSEDLKLITRFGNGDATLQDIADRVLMLHESETDMETLPGIAERDVRDTVVLNYFSLVLDQARNLHGILEVSRLV
jgi:hypothetical protein